MNHLAQLSKIGPKTEEKLNKLGIYCPKDLLYHFPNRYLDFSKSTSIAATHPDDNFTVTGQIISFQNIYTRSHKNIQKAIIKDATGSIDLLWFNQPYLAQTFKINQVYSFAGTVSLYQNRKTIIAPEYGQYHTGKIIAVYPETKGLTSKWFRQIIQNQLSTLISNISDPLPKSLLQSYGLLNLKSALSQIHCPQNSDILNKARIRLGLDEILNLQAQSYLSRQAWLQKKPVLVIQATPSIKKQINQLIKGLPFELTIDQKNAWKEILDDLTSTNKITNRLLQGDVGSGKTIIALLAAYLTSLNHFSTLILAPTEILSQQHFATFKKLLKLSKIPIHLLTSSQKINFLKLKPNSIIIGTHAAIFQKNKLPPQIGLLIIDEQHKFGVKQRSFLSDLASPPHCLTMTATPIPRTISLTMLGNLSLTTINSSPLNRLPPKTYLVPESKTTDCYRWLEKHLKSTGQQAFIVCPFIDVSESLAAVKSAQKEYDHLSRSVFPKLKLALIHGRLKQTDRDLIIKDFISRKIDILVTTPIIEVGIDIPNATVIIIQSADRFGLAQLHQLRGRVGRGGDQGYCYLFADESNQKAKNRLLYLSSHHQGAELAQYDLKTRGPGELFATLQHGFPSLKIASLSDTKLISLSQEIINHLIQSYPHFNLNLLTNRAKSAIVLHN